MESRLESSSIPLFKVVIVGDAHVGKSCLAIRQSDGVFNENYNVTIGVEFKNTVVNLNDELVKLQLVKPI